LGPDDLTSILRPENGEEAPPARLLPVALAQQFLEQYLPVRGVQSPLQFFERQGNNIVVVKARAFGVGGKGIGTGRGKDAAAAWSKEKPPIRRARRFRSPRSVAGTASYPIRWSTQVAHSSRNGPGRFPLKLARTSKPVKLEILLPSTGEKLPRARKSLAGRLRRLRNGRGDSV